MKTDERPCPKIPIDDGLAAMLDPPFEPNDVARSWAAIDLVFGDQRGGAASTALVRTGSKVVSRFSFDDVQV